MLGIGRLINLARSLAPRAIDAVAALATVCAVRWVKRMPTKIIWGPIPLISNKSWSRAMREAGWDSETLMTHHYPQHVSSDFDRYFDDVVPTWIRSPARRAALAPYFAFLYIIRHARVVHISYLGGPLGTTRLRTREAQLLGKAGVKVVVMSYGSDGWMYSRIFDPSLRNAMLINYPAAAREEPEISARVAYWNRHADIVITMLQVDGMGRWDVTTPSCVCLDVRDIRPKATYSDADGSNGVVRVIHTPNHRGVKGTEFLIRAVDELRQEGLQIELTLVEGVPNSQVKDMLLASDILAEHLIGNLYGLSGIEGMSCGLPVMGNMESETYTRVFRRYAFLNECPVVSSSPETVKRNLRALVRNPKLRETLGRAGRRYAEKYHSYAMAQYLFGAVYEKLLRGGNPDLMNLFHPLLSEYNRRIPTVEHPLHDNRLTESHLQ